MPPLIDFLSRRKYHFKGSPEIPTEANTTKGWVVQNLQNVFLYARKGFDTDDPHVAEKNLRIAKMAMQSIFVRIDSSERNRAYEWTTKTGAVRTFSRPLDEMIHADIHCYLMIKQMPKESLDAVERVCTDLYYARSWWRNLPHAEIGVRIEDYWLSLRVGRNLAFEVLPSLDPFSQNDLMQETLYSTDKLLRYIGKRAVASKERYGEKYVESGSWISAQLDLHTDAITLENCLREKPVEPNIDPTAANVNLEDNELWYIDFEKLNKMVTRGHQRAHTIFDPAFSTSFDQRIAISERDLDDAWFYLTRQVGWRYNSGMAIPFMKWKNTARERFLGYVRLWKQLSEIPYIKKKYALASIAGDLYFSDVAIHCSEIITEES